MTFLERIAEDRRKRVAADQKETSLKALRARCENSPKPRDAHAMLARWPQNRRAVIAEVKRRSPSKGPLCPDIDAVELARTYERAGAFAISVLAEPDHFGGRIEDLELVRSAVDLPLLCKDFVIEPYQLWEARAAGADLVLLIVALLGQQTPAYVSWARAAGVEPLVEVHGSDELEVALAAGARWVGINNRDLKTFQVDLSVTRQLLPRVPRDVWVVSESGLKTAEDLDNLGQAGARAFLVGEALVTAPDPGAALRRLVEK